MFKIGNIKTIETRRKLSEALRGEKSPTWQDWNIFYYPSFFRI